MPGRTAMRFHPRIVYGLHAFVVLVSACTVSPPRAAACLTPGDCGSTTQWRCFNGSCKARCVGSAECASGHCRIADGFCADECFAASDCAGTEACNRNGDAAGFCAGSNSSAGGTAGRGGGAGGGGAGGGGMAPGGGSARAPNILTLSANVQKLFPTQQLIIAAVVSDPDGVDDLIGGTLSDPMTNATYGAFATSAAEGAYQLTLTWNAINTVSPINTVTGGSKRAYRATFFDVAGNSVARNLEITMACPTATDAACGGECMRLDVETAHCGGCGNSCFDVATAHQLPTNTAGCRSSTCYASVREWSRKSCNTICGAKMLVCSKTTPVGFANYRGDEDINDCSSVPPNWDASQQAYFTYMECSCYPP